MAQTPLLTALLTFAVGCPAGAWHLVHPEPDILLPLKYQLFLLNFLFLLTVPHQSPATWSQNLPQSHLSPSELLFSVDTPALNQLMSPSPSSSAVSFHSRGRSQQPSADPWDPSGPQPLHSLTSTSDVWVSTEPHWIRISGNDPW